MSLRRTLPAVLVAFGAMATPAAAAPTLTQFPAGTGPSGVATGANGDIWFADAPDPGAIGRISPTLAVTSFTTGLANDKSPRAITAGPGGMWYTQDEDQIGRITPSGAITDFGTSGLAPAGIAAGPDGNLWYTASDDDEAAIVRLTPAGTRTTFSSGVAQNARPQGIALGPDGNLWFTLSVAKRIGRITPQGAITTFPTGSASGSPREITAGPDGRLWFTQDGMSPRIGRITTGGSVTLFSAGLPFDSAPSHIAAGADGNLHFTDRGAKRDRAHHARRGDH